MHEMQSERARTDFRLTSEKTSSSWKNVPFVRIQRDRGSTATCRQDNHTRLGTSRGRKVEWRADGRRKDTALVSNYYSRVCLPTSGNDSTAGRHENDDTYILPAFSSILFSRTFWFTLCTFLGMPQKGQL